ncbi:hypothetical protein [Alcaligenes faecalis]|uniref:hypothetical protein n=1 Tax=Alcaligenes faecalis TaxID=511 RepID=UPI000F674820|nr:hypothetical protein [Alcaligenes faecalis]
MATTTGDRGVDRCHHLFWFKAHTPGQRRISIEGNPMKNIIGILISIIVSFLISGLTVLMFHYLFELDSITSFIAAPIFTVIGSTLIYDFVKHEE